MRMLNLFLRVAACWLMLSHLYAEPARAQRAVPVSLVLKDTFGREDIVAILRIEPGKYRAPILALKRDAATAALLASMISALAEATAKTGTPYLSIEWTTKHSVRHPDATALRQAESLLTRLRSITAAQRTDIGRVSELAVTLQLASSSRTP